MMDNILDLVWEILVRLPTKSLMRFKCVSKQWYSIIRNPKFAIGHGNGNNVSLLITDIHYNSDSLFQKFFYVNANDDSPQLMHNHLTIEEGISAVFTSVVKGLIGFYIKGCFTLCNIATHEMLKLPPCLPQSPSNDVINHFYLGFDPVEESYKVLNMCVCFGEGEFPITLGSHIFTLGVNYSDMNWRKRIASTSFDSHYLYQQCICINGDIYLLNERLFGPESLTVFHLHSETFEIIAIPECTKLGGADLVEISGSPALIVSTNVDMLDVWTMSNHCGGGELELWTRKKLVLPRSTKYTHMRLAFVMNCDAFTKLYYVGMLPTGEIMSTHTELCRFPFPIYIYDHLKNKSKSITIDGYGSQESRIKLLQQMKICYYEENIISLAFLSSKFKMNALES